MKMSANAKTPNSKLTNFYPKMPKKKTPPLNGPSKTGEPSGPGRGNNPPKTKPKK